MNKFSIDERLLNDCHLITQSDGLNYLLHGNAEVAWFILVPQTRQTEFYQLDTAFQKKLCRHINQLSEFIRSNFNSDKINVASIGNVVSQMHIHVIGRRLDDAYWPDVVWGREFEKTYDDGQLASISDQLISYLASVRRTNK